MSPEIGTLRNRVAAFASRHNRLARDLLVLAAVIYLAFVWQYLLVAGSHVDVAAYWRAAGGDPYALSQLGEEGALLYSPVASQFLAPFASFPLEVLTGALLLASLGAAVFLVGPVISAVVLLIPLPYVWQDLSSGNIHTLVAAAVVLGFRYPAAWSFVLLTKLTPGIGLLWFVARREWHALVVALGATLALSVISFLIAPRLWVEWISVLRSNASVPPEGVFVPLSLRVRLLVAAALVWWGARHEHPWTVPAAALIGLPAIWIYDGFAVLLGALAVAMPAEFRRRIAWPFGVALLPKSQEHLAAQAQPSGAAPECGD